MLHSDGPLERWIVALVGDCVRALVRWKSRPVAPWRNLPPADEHALGTSKAMLKQQLKRTEKQIQILEKQLRKIQKALKSVK